MVYLQCKDFDEYCWYFYKMPISCATSSICAFAVERLDARLTSCTPAPSLQALSYTSSSDIRVFRGWIRCCPNAVIYQINGRFSVAGFRWVDSGEQHPRFQSCVSFLSGADFLCNTGQCFAFEIRGRLNQCHHDIWYCQGATELPAVVAGAIDNENFTQLTKALNFVADVSVSCVNRDSE